MRLTLFFMDVVYIVEELIVKIMIIVIARSDHFVSLLHRGSNELTRIT